MAAAGPGRACRAGGAGGALLTRAGWPSRGEILYGFAALDACAIDPGCLSPEERRRAEGFHAERDRRRFVGRHALLRRWVGTLTGQAPAAVHILAGRHGKPTLPGTGLDCTLSHADGVALLALAAGQPIGGDILREDPSLPVAGLVGLAFSPREQAAWRALPLPERLACFQQAWICKEALVKAVGCGISLPLDQVPILHRAAGPMLDGPLATGPLQGRWSLLRLAAPRGFQAALAAPGKGWACRGLDLVAALGPDEPAGARATGGARPGTAFPALRAGPRQ